ncbi:uncharacterized protein LOC131162701 [Malania oleifera]|uniref:uncharacterized protein LOC131162701 n=1 Tax=Malania oleifera TaxID=397392 RepID=UPI0025AECA5E|nr:uncharacterized protein LOC131162701 [Malania oleifera]
MAYEAALEEPPAGLLLSLDCRDQLTVVNLLSQWVKDNQISSSQIYNYWEAKGSKVIWHKEVWRCGCTLKHAFILSLVIKGKLTTCDVLKGVLVDHVCLLCGTEDESVGHLISSVGFLILFGGLCETGWGLMSTLKAAVKWLHKEVKGTGVQAVAKRISLATKVYSIWYFQNKRRFEGKAISPECVFRVIQIHVYRVLHDRFPLFSLDRGLFDCM